MSEKIDDLCNSKCKMSQILSLLTKLQPTIEAKDKQIQTLGDRVEQLEQYLRKENVMISGVKSCSHPACPPDIDIDGENAPDDEFDSLEKQAFGY